MLAAQHAHVRIRSTRTAANEKCAPSGLARLPLRCTRREGAILRASPLHARCQSACLLTPASGKARRPACAVAASASPTASDDGEDEEDYGATETATPTSNWKRGWRLASRAAVLVKNNVWPILVLFAACDLAIFLLHRVCHRLVNEVAIRFLLPEQLSSVEALGGSLWWLSNNADIANFQTGYQWLVLLGFLVMFPISVLLRTFATASSLLVVAENLESERKLRWLPPVKEIAGQLKRHAGAVKSILLRVWQVDLLVAVRAIPLQGMCLLVVPIPWVLPWLLNLQLAVPLSMFEGEYGDDAVKASRRVVEPVRGALAFPFIGLLLLSKLLGFLGRIFLTQLSPRIARDIPEIPIGIYVFVGAATVILSRIQDMLPLVTYIEAKKAYGVDPKLELAA